MTLKDPRASALALAEPVPADAEARRIDHEAVQAAETLRDEGFDGRVVLVGAEEERPYERPPLSKDYLLSEVGREKVYVHDEGYYAGTTSSYGSAARR